MRPKAARFVTSATSPKQYPPPLLPEVAIAGRSNVGKSSLINALVGKPGLAKTSSTPGRTQLLNWFEIEPAKGKPMNLVDLPGYGYAKVPQAIRSGWQPMIESYLTGREVLRGVVLLIDARRGAEREEAELAEWLDHESIPLMVTLTKSDKLSKAKRKPVAALVRRTLGLRRDPIVSSAESGDGLDELWRGILALVRGPT